MSGVHYVLCLYFVRPLTLHRSCQQIDTNFVIKIVYYMIHVAISNL